MFADSSAKTDVVEKDYIGWAIKNGFEVIDVNVPKIDSVADVGLIPFSRQLLAHI